MSCPATLSLLTINCHAPQIHFLYPCAIGQHNKPSPIFCVLPAYLGTVFQEHNDSFSFLYCSMPSHRILAPPRQAEPRHALPSPVLN